MRKLDSPDPEFVSGYIQAHDQTVQYSNEQKALSELFKAYPLNNQIEGVLLKVLVVNSIYNTNIYATYLLAQHICSLDIDAKLAQKSLEVVDEIARVNFTGKKKNFYSFATKYCSRHDPETYPIYDQYVDKLLVHYQKQDTFAKFKKKDLRVYSEYKRILEEFRTNYRLTQFSLQDLDKFLWLYGRKMFKKTNKPRNN